MIAHHSGLTPLLLDGSSLAARRAPMIAARAAAVRENRGHPPHLMLVAFGDEHGRVPHVDRKLRACATAGVEVLPLILPPGTVTRTAIARLQGMLADTSVDAVFVQFPFPRDIDGDEFAARIPIELDVDIMTPARTAHFMMGQDALPPVTVSAGLLLLDAYAVAVAGLPGVVIAAESPFARMFREALARRGARMAPLVSPAAGDLDRRVSEAALVVAAAAAPSVIASTSLARGAVAIDVGYFNEGGRGDIDVSGGIGHLKAIAPVPGGIGPMTISALIERVVQFAGVE